MNIFICTRAIVVPLVFFITGHKYVVNPLLLFSTLIMPFLWLIFYYFYSEPAMTCLCALGVLICFFFLYYFVKFENTNLMKAFKIINKINLFELILFYFPSALFSSFGFYSSMHLYFLGIELI